MTTDPLAVVEAFLAAQERFDFERARELLADQGFSFRSPVLCFDSADHLIQYSAHSSGIIQSVETRKVFVDGPDVCHLLTYRIQISEKLAVDVAHWAYVGDGRIQRIEAIFDASLYRDLFPTDLRAPV
ncbi:MAG TPA: hypothetical protein VES73_00645 [Lamprocystis sp. (in: g-proteobacteria)]|nr:hypothetical protein [Lamprocystis sp. (in: g-proteobacteria)]